MHTFFARLGKRRVGEWDPEAVGRCLYRVSLRDGFSNGLL